MKQVYEAVVTAHGGREGRVVSSDGILDLEVSLPKSMGGNEEHTNPEQLFAAGYAACFHSAVAYVAKTKKLSTEDSNVAAHVSLNTGGVGEFDLAVRLEVSLPHLEKDVAEQLIAEAHKVCPYSRATNGNIAVQVELAS